MAAGCGTNLFIKHDKIDSDSLLWDAGGHEIGEPYCSDLINPIMAICVYVLKHDITHPAENKGHNIEFHSLSPVYGIEH